MTDRFSFPNRSRARAWIWLRHLVVVEAALLLLGQEVKNLLENGLSKFGDQSGPHLLGLSGSVEKEDLIFVGGAQVLGFR
jgi:hypothetical protein